MNLIKDKFIENKLESINVDLFKKLDKDEIIKSLIQRKSTQNSSLDILIEWIQSGKDFNNDDEYRELLESLNNICK